MVGVGLLAVVVSVAGFLAFFAGGDTDAAIGLFLALGLAAGCDFGGFSNVYFLSLISVSVPEARTSAVEISVFLPQRTSYVFSTSI